MTARTAGKPPTPKARQTQARLLTAGIELFSGQGYHATSLRDVEGLAGVQRNLVTYHFGSKEEFWKGCMRSLFVRVDAAMRDVPGMSADVEPVERIRRLIRRYLIASAANPELMCVMLDEGRRDEWRLAWLVENHVQSFYEAVQRVFEAGRQQGVVPDVSPVQFYYLLVSSASIFTVAPECRLLSGTDPTDPEIVDAHVETIASLLTTRPQREGESQ